MTKWLPLGVLAAAQFVMVLDSSVMNVSISQIVADLDTTVQGVQLAITMYTLVMAAFMLVGAKLGDIYGRSRIFTVGLAVYGLGSLTTALSPNLAVLLVGWSGIEGIGAVMVIPAIAALIVNTYEGKDRATAYGLVGGAAGAAVAAGPLIGGWVTTTFSWRWVFAGEVVVVIVILLLRGRLPSGDTPARRPQLDGIGATLSALGLGLVVFAVLQSSTWGWIRPHNPPVVGGRELEPLGLSVVPFLIAAGFGLLYAFGRWELRRERERRDTLLDRSLLAIPTLRAGLGSLSMQQLVLMGTFFVLPVYLQIVVGLDAFETGKRLFPMSISMLVAALGGPRLAARFAPRRVAQLGFVAIAAAAFLLTFTIDVHLDRWHFSVALAIFGVGAGLLISQLGNVIMSSVDPSHSNEAGGLQGTAQNLGASVGTALIGAIMLTFLTSAFVSNISDNPALSQKTQTAITQAAADNGLDVVPIPTVEAAAQDAGLSAHDAEAVASDYGDALLGALSKSLAGVGVLALLGLLLTRGLPARSAQREPVPLAGDAVSGARR